MGNYAWKCLILRIQAAVKGQVLADLVAEFTEELGPGDFEEVRKPKEAVGVNSIAT